MIQPNTLCGNFCTWLLTSSYQRFSVARMELIEAVQTAAVDITPISQHNWNQFINVTASYYPAYTMQLALQV